MEGTIRTVSERAAVTERIKDALHRGHPPLNEDLRALMSYVEKLEREGVPGVTHVVDREFHKLAILERNHERERNNRLRAIIRTLRGGVDLDGE